MVGPPGYERIRRKVSWTLSFFTNFTLKFINIFYSTISLNIFLYPGAPDLLFYVYLFPLRTPVTITARAPRFILADLRGWSPFSHFHPYRTSLRYYERYLFCILLTLFFYQLNFDPRARLVPSVNSIASICCLCKMIGLYLRTSFPNTQAGTGEGRGLYVVGPHRAPQPPWLRYPSTKTHRGVKFY